MASFDCPMCGSELWDNRSKRANDPEWADSPDFVCKDKKECGWKGNLDQDTGELTTVTGRGGGRPRRGGGPSRQGGGAAGGGKSYPPKEPIKFDRYAKMYAKCHGIITDLFGEATDPSVIAAATATLFIGAKDCAEMRVSPKPHQPQNPAPMPRPAVKPAPRPYAEVPEALEPEDDDLPF